MSKNQTHHMCIDPLIWEDEEESYIFVFRIRIHIPPFCYFLIFRSEMLVFCAVLNLNSNCSLYITTSVSWRLNITYIIFKMIAYLLF
jgi:hypothetical protein